MITTLSTNDIIDALLSDEYANWDYDTAKALAHFYEDLEDSTGEPIELDVVAIRCEWSEASKEEVRSNYNIDDGVDVIEYLNDHTTCINIDFETVLFMEF
jgi:hypothetical protein